MAQYLPTRLAPALLSALLLTALPLPAPAQVTKYKCIYGNGEVSHQNEPCGHIPPSQRTAQGGLATLERQRAERAQQDASANMAMFNSQVTVGMDSNQVRQAWGSPDSINQSSGSGYATETWTYHQTARAPYRSVNFSDGKVSGVNVSHSAPSSR